MPWFAVKEAGVEVGRLYAEDVDSLRMNVRADQVLELIASPIPVPQTNVPPANGEG